MPYVWNAPSQHDGIFAPFGQLSPTGSGSTLNIGAVKRAVCQGSVSPGPSTTIVCDDQRLSFWSQPIKVVGMYIVFPDQSLPFEELQIGTQRLEDRLLSRTQLGEAWFQKPNAFSYCPIMACTKPVISPPMHPLWLHRKRVCNAEIKTAQTLSHL